MQHFRSSHGAIFEGFQRSWTKWTGTPALTMAYEAEEPKQLAQVADPPYFGNMHPLIPGMGIRLQIPLIYSRLSTPWPYNN